MQDKEESIDFIVQVLKERDSQDIEWGGPDHDDEHSSNDWRAFIHHQSVKADSLNEYPIEYQSRMIKIAALAMAAYQSNKRKSEVDGY